MWRCIELAKLGAGNVAPNPMVGAVLVYNNCIIAEGYHMQYGKPHAEVNCLNNVLEIDKKNICKSTLYVSLEPCSHFGKTPPCADLIIKNNIPHVIIGCSDEFEKVNGNGIKKLIAAGIKVETAVLQEECVSLNKRFFTFHQKKRPYIILKWAQSMDGFIAGNDGKTIKISNKFTDVLVHKWRAEEASILIGTNTAINDDPTLTTRHWKGNNPVRVLIDPHLKTPLSAKLFDSNQFTVIINNLKTEKTANVLYYKKEENESIIETTLKCLFNLNIISCIIEGGSITIQSFINKGLWDEARVITNTRLAIGEGIKAPELLNAIVDNKTALVNDCIIFYTNVKNELL